MSTDRLEQRKAQFSKALNRLEDACDQEENEFIRDAVIRRFEFCFELAWKMLRAKLLRDGIDAASPRQVIREAVSSHLLDDGNRWSEMLLMRNRTSHTYDSALAMEVYRFICDEGMTLFRSLAEKARLW